MSETPTETDPDRGARREYDAGAMRWLSGLVSLIGLWIAASPFVYEVTEAAFWNDVIVGLAIFLVAGYNFYRTSRNRVASTGSASLVALLGLWALLAPFVIEFGSQALLWSNVIAGLVVAVIGAYNAYASRQAATAPAGARA